MAAEDVADAFFAVEAVPPGAGVMDPRVVLSPDEKTSGLEPIQACPLNFTFGHRNTLNDEPPKAACQLHHSDVW